MKRLLIYILLFFYIQLTYSQNIVNEDISADINPGSSWLKVKATVKVIGKDKVTFSLNSSLKIISTSPNVKLKILKNGKANDLGMDRDVSASAIKTTVYRIKLKGEDSVFTVIYQGKIDSLLHKNNNNYQRGFSESAGIINSKGVYLAGATYWVPSFDSALITFTLKAAMPQGWKSVSQGKRAETRDISGKHTDTWVCIHPQEEVFLIAAPFTEYSYVMNNGIMAMAFLRTPDQGLANKYLEVTEQYMEMYQNLIGSYPYSKFALVENFWETGYGMPSFTLLGEKIIRFPFILHSSYPHELLHNWWGNSVYVDFNQGNWCEGITAYMADHLIKEQRGQGEDYRRSVLKKFTDFVTPENDFPLNEFISRYDAPSEAIGYGKALMMWHMLRRKLGDEQFKKGWRQFYNTFKFKIASFADIRQIFEITTDEQLDVFFNQWVKRKGAPKVEITSVKKDSYNNAYRLFLTLRQNQPDSVFVLDIPVLLATAKGQDAFVVHMDRREQTFQLFPEEKPLKLAVDPQFDVFRKVDPNEVPPALSKIWAAKNNILILPSKADKNDKEVYLTFAEQWQKYDNDNFQVVYDDRLEKLPDDKTPWIIGIENRFADTINNIMKEYHSHITTDSIKIQGKILPVKDNSFVVTVFDPKNAERSFVFIQPGNIDAVQGLVRKLPHYGKYSYLVFKGSEPVNILKGTWPVIHSPMVAVFDSSAAALVLKTERKALAYVKPVFSAKRMMEHIRTLASGELKGRGLGTPQLDSAAGYIAAKFEKFGLQPAGEDYFQIFQKNFPQKPGKKDLTLKNIIAVIPGTDSLLKDYPVVVSAHYDHLGRGWPDVHAGDEGKIHYGADDNASGVAIMLELAKNMANLKPKRSIVFVAFTGEEAGLVGSRYFVQHYNNLFKGKPFADINLDTDGSLFDKKLMVLNGNTAREWKFIFMGTDYTTGIKSEVLTTDLDASDQVAFIEKEIPAVQLFTGATVNYHRPTDTWEKIDSTGLIKVAVVAKEVVEYLADRKEPMPFTGKKGGHGGEKEITGKIKNKRASTGSVPDFGYGGQGVKIGSVIERSAGDKAGLKAGDVILAVNGEKITDLRNYTSVLRKYKPGEKAVFTILRKGEKKEITLVFGER